MVMDVDPVIVDFLKRNKVAVLATAGMDARPHAAAVFYETDSNSNIFFVTKEDTAKSKNLQANPQASMVIFEAKSLRTAQIYGGVTRMQNEAMLQKALRIMSRHSSETSGSSATPISKLDAGAYVLYMLTPEVIRLGDYKYGAKNFIFDVATPAEGSLDY